MLVAKAEAAIFDFRDAQRNAKLPNLPMASYFHWAAPPLLHRALPVVLSGTRQK